MLISWKRTILGLLFSTILFAQYPWQNIGPGAGSDLHFMAIHPTNADIIYVGGDIEGLFKTTDGGQTWTNINNNLAHSSYSGDVYWINDIVIDPVDYEKVYICTAVGLFRSLNGGQSWTLLYPSSLADEEDGVSVSTIAIDAANTNRMFIGFGNGADGSYADFEPFPAYEGVSGFASSVDGGANWTATDIGMPPATAVHSIVISPIDPNQVTVATTNGIYASADGGTAWASKNTGLPHTNLHRMKGVLVEDTFTLFLTVKVLGTISDSTTFSGGFFKTTNGGDSWTDLTGDLPKYDAYEPLFYDYWKFDVDPVDPEIIYIGTTRGSGYEEPGVYASWDGGLIWELVHDGTNLGWMNDEWFSDPYAFDIKVAPSNPDRIAICADLVVISNDAGETWNQSYTTSVNGAWQGRGLELMNTDGIAFHQNNADIVYIGYDDMGLFRTEDGGSSYFRLDPLQDPAFGALTDIDAVKDIMVDPSNGDLYISRWQGSQGGYNAGFTAGGIAMSSDMGNTITEISSGLTEGRCDLILDQTSGSAGNRTLYTAIYNDGVYKSTNSGSSWTSINTGLGADAAAAWEIAIDPSNSSTLYLGVNTASNTQVSLYKSTDAGGNWSLLSNFPAGDVLAIYVDDASTVYASMADDFDWSYAGGLYKSSDGGTSWTQLNDHSRIIDIDVHPLDNNTILVAGQQWYMVSGDAPELLLSTDAGSTWTEISAGMNHTFFNFARFNPNKPEDIYVGTGGGGLWRLTEAFTGVNDDVGIIGSFRLDQNYPNPFNPNSTINFSLPESSDITLKVYDISGREIQTLVNANQSTGNYSVQWDGTTAEGLLVETGVYFAMIQASDYSEVIKMVYLR